MVSAQLSPALAAWAEVDHREDLPDERWLNGYRIARFLANNGDPRHAEIVEAFRADMPDIVSRAGG